jgi:hypothetical protein
MINIILETIKNQYKPQKQDLKSCGFTAVRVQVPSRVPKRIGLLF